MKSPVCGIRLHVVDNGLKMCKISAVVLIEQDDRPTGSISLPRVSMDGRSITWPQKYFCHCLLLLLLLFYEGHTINYIG